VGRCSCLWSWCVSLWCCDLCVDQCGCEDPRLRALSHIVPEPTLQQTPVTVVASARDHTNMNGNGITTTPPTGTSSDPTSPAPTSTASAATTSSTTGSNGLIRTLNGDGLASHHHAINGTASVSQSLTLAPLGVSTPSAASAIPSTNVVTVSVASSPHTAAAK
jgi:hypothetical protein